MTAIRRGARFGSLACGLIWSALAAPAFAAPTWLAPQTLSAAGEEAHGGRIALGSGGDALAGWYRSEGSNFVVQVSGRAAGGSWETPVNLSAPGEEAMAPAVAVDGAGDAVALWHRKDGVHPGVIEATGRPAGGGWESPRALSPPDQAASSPRVDATATGEAIAVWSRYDGTRSTIQAASRHPGGGWEDAVDISTLAQNSLSPAVDQNARGDAVAVWFGADGSSGVIEAATKAPGAGWGPPERISPLGVGAIEPQVAVDPVGGAVAVWQSFHDGHYFVTTASRPLGGGWSEATDLSSPGESALRPQVAVDATGNAVAVWERSDGTNTIIQAASRPAGGGWGAPTDLSAPGEDSVNVHLAIDPRGNAVSVWQRFEGPRQVVQATTKTGSGPWQAPVDISAPGENAIEPELDIDDSGDAVATWRRKEGGNYVIQIAALDAAGPQLRSLSIPPSGPAGAPLSFAVTPFDIWSAAGPVAWSFGAGVTVAGTAATHTYPTPGDYAVAVNGGDAVGNTSSAAGGVAIWQVSAPRRARVKAGRALLTLRCHGSVGCRGSAKLTVHRKATARDRHSHDSGIAKVRTIGTATFALAAGQTKAVPFKLGARGKKLVGAAGKRGSRVRIQGVGVDPRGLKLVARG